MDHPPVGAKINRLFELRRRADGKPYTLTQVVTAIASYGDPDATIGESYLCRLRKRPERHPDALSPARRAAIARFFRVDPAYFDVEHPVDPPPWLELRSPTPGAPPAADGRAAAVDDNLMLIYGRALDMSPLERQVWLEMADLVKRVAAGASSSHQA